MAEHNGHTEHTNADLSTVYHEEIPEHLLVGPAKGFVLYATNRGTREPEDAVVWGLEFPDSVVTVFRGPYDGRWTFGVHDTTEQARWLYKWAGELHLEYL